MQLDYLGSLNDTSDKLAADCLTVLKMPELQIV